MTAPADAAIEVRLLDPGETAPLDRVAADVFDGPVVARWRDEFAADPRHHLAVATAGGTVIGMASALHYVHPDKPPELWINEVGVDGAWRRRGVGRRLVAALLAHGRALGCAQAWVLTEPDNAEARALYEAAGGRPGGPTVLYEFPLDADGA